MISLLNRALALIALAIPISASTAVMVSIDFDQATDFSNNFSPVTGGASPSSGGFVYSSTAGVGGTGGLARVNDTSTTFSFSAETVSSLEIGQKVTISFDVLISEPDTSATGVALIAGLKPSTYNDDFFSGTVGALGGIELTQLGPTINLEYTGFTQPGGTGTRVSASGSGSVLNGQSQWRNVALIIEGLGSNEIRTTTSVEGASTIVNTSTMTGTLQGSEPYEFGIQMNKTFREFDNFSFSIVPEPGTTPFLLLALGLGFVLRRRT